MSGRPLYVFGAGGHGKVVAEAARFNLGYRVRAFLDDDRKRWGQEWDSLPVLGGRALLASLEDDAEVALGLGENEMRAEVAQAVLSWGRGLATVVHPSAVIARGVSLGPGTYVAPLAVLHTDAQVGRGCIVNSGAVVEHDCRAPRSGAACASEMAPTSHWARSFFPDWRLAPGPRWERGPSWFIRFRTTPPRSGCRRE